MHMTQQIVAEGKSSVCLPFIVDKLYEIEKCSKKPNFATAAGGLNYLIPDQHQQQSVNGRKKGSRILKE